MVGVSLERPSIFALRNPLLSPMVRSVTVLILSPPFQALVSRHVATTGAFPRRIRSPKDLHGLSVAVPFGSTCHYHLIFLMELFEVPAAARPPLLYLDCPYLACLDQDNRHALPAKSAGPTQIFSTYWSCRSRCRFSSWLPQK
eukprot:scaffold87451_cov30-Tisochrysis_lutea.AAC.3